MLRNSPEAVMLFNDNLSETDDGQGGRVSGPYTFKAAKGYQAPRGSAPEPVLQTPNRFVSVGILANVLDLHTLIPSN